MASSETIKILFYPHSARAFSSSLIGHLAELSQEFSVVLLTEPLHPSYAKVLEDRSLFPMLDRVEILPRPGYSILELVRSNRAWYQLARRLVKEVRPQVVITENDMSSLLDMYLLRAGKEFGSMCLTIQGMAQIEDVKMQKLVELAHIYRGNDKSGPIQKLWRTFLYDGRKWLGHFLVHFLLPWSLGTSALRGGSSYVLRKGASGLRESDLNLVPTLQAWRAHTMSGVSASRLALLTHPIMRVPHILYFPTPETGAASCNTFLTRNMLVLLSSEHIGFRRDNYSLISHDQRLATRLEILHLVCRILPTWDVHIKPHPDCGSLADVQNYLGDLDRSVVILPPSVPVEPYLKSADAILSLPLSSSTTLFTAASAFPQKPIISINVDDEFYGDNYKDFPGVDYITSMPELENLLNDIAAAHYQKPKASCDEESTLLRFKTTNDAVRHLIP